MSRPGRTPPPRIIEGLDAEIVHEYPEATTVYVAESDLSEVQRRASIEKLESTIRDDFDILQLPGGHIDARRGTAASLPGKQLGPEAQAGSPGLYLLQFAGPITAEWTDALTAAGITVIQYIPYNAYIVAGRPADLNAVSRLHFVQFVDVFHAVLKTQAVSREGSSDILISVANIADTSKLVRDLSRLSHVDLTTEVLGEVREELRIRGTFDGTDIEKIVNERLVYAVSPYPHVELSDERSAAALGPNITSQGTLPTVGGQYQAWLEAVCTGCSTLYDDEFYVGVADMGFWAGPQNAAGAADPGPADLPTTHVIFGTDFSVTPATTAHTPTTFDDLGGHGTFVASILAANPATGTDPEGYRYGMGVAPTAGLVVTKINVSRTALTPIALSAHDAIGKGAFVQNHSYNETLARQNGPNQSPPCDPPAPDGKYSILSRDFDRAVRDSNDNTSDGITPITLVVSAGNQADTFAHLHCADRTLTNPPATAKNVIAVGGTETPRHASEAWNCRGAGINSLNNVEPDSKRATAVAGWFKPDLMAPAGNVVGLRDDSVTQGAFSCVHPTDTTYVAGTGTSFAAPVGTSAALLASRAYADAPGAASPALLKAILIMGARSMKGGTDYAAGTPTAIGAIPNQSQGFGRINLEDILEPYPARSYLDQTYPLAPEQTWTNTYAIHDGNRPVTVVLTWTDVPAQVSVGIMITNPLVNDLDLSLYQGATCTERYIGNKLSPTTEHAVPVACGVVTPDPFDRKNNVEYLRFTGAAGSTFTVTVGFKTGTGTQHFALAVHNAHDTDQAPPGAPSGVTATGTSSTTVGVSWNSVPTATSYDVRLWDGGPFWKTLITEFAGTSFPVTSLAPMTTYLLDVRARNNAGVSAASIPDAATTFATGGTALFTDDPLAAGVTIVKAQHIDELRAAISAASTAAGIGTPTFTDEPLTAIPVKALHLDELREELDAAREALGLPAVTYSDAVLSGVAVKAIHIQELRDAIR